MTGFTAKRSLARVLLALALVVPPAVTLADIDDTDTDLDDVHDDVDNCPLVFNPDQAVGNNDSLGDLCTAESVQFSLAESPVPQSALELPSDAGRITVRLKGRVFRILGSLSHEFRPGEIGNVVYSYDAKAPAGRFGYYPLIEYAGTLGDYRFGMKSGSIQLLDNTVSFGDQIFVRSVATGPPVGAAKLESAFAFFRDHDGEFLTGTNLITRAPDLDAMEHTGFALRFDHPVEGFLNVQIRIDQAVLVIPVDVDIKPSSDTNAIALSSRGAIPIAILGSNTFDIGDVDVTTLAFGPDVAQLTHSSGPHFEDVDGDGFTDLVSHFRIEETGIEFGDREACMSGETFVGAPFRGCDAVRTVPDMDGDALLDVEEATIGTDALNRDTDGDGFTDGQEVLLMGTDPLDPLDPEPTPVPEPASWLVLVAGTAVLGLLYRRRARNYPSLH